MSELNTQHVIDTYKKRWNIKDSKQYDINADQFIPSALKEGEEFIDESKKVKYSRTNGKLVKQSLAFVKKEASLDMAVCGCGKKLKNPNEHNVFLQTGKCFTCHAVEETKAIATKQPRQLKEWDKEVFFIDDKGNAVMNERDFVAHHGSKKAFVLLDNILTQFKSWKEAGKYVNEYRENLVRNFHRRLFFEIKDDLDDMIEDVKNRRSVSDAQLFTERINEIRNEYFSEEDSTNTEIS